MPDHSWVCSACKNKNPPYTEACRDCGVLAAIAPESGVKSSAAPESVSIGHQTETGKQQIDDMANRSSPTLDAAIDKRQMDGGSLIAENNRNQESELFFASKKSPLAKARIYSALGLASGLAIAILKQGGFSSGILFTAIIVFLIALSVDWFLRQQLRLGEPLVTLTDEAVDAPNLVGKGTRLQWRDIDKITVETSQGHRLIAFHLKAHEGMNRGRNFWTGADPSKPTLGLSALDSSDQERLLDSLMRHHRQAAGEVSSELPRASIQNEMKEEREFQERIAALEPITWVTYALIAANALVWLTTLAYGASLLQTPADKLLIWGGNAASEVQKGEWWRMLTATFLHSGFIHVAMNMLGLYTAGMIVERIYGPRLFLIVYFGSGLLGSALSLYFSAQHAVSVGASGAVFGVTGALLVAVLQHRDKMPKSFSRQTLSGVGLFVFYSLLQGFGKSGIDNAAHIGGLLGGCLAAFILPERFDMDHYQRTLRKRAVGALMVFGLTTVSLAAMAPQATIDQGRIVASAPLLDHALKAFDSAMKAIQVELSDVTSARVSERESDNRSRSVHAPRFRAVADELSKVALRPGDPRGPLVTDIRRMAELLTELLAMESVFDEKSGKFKPSDAARAAKLEGELVAVSARVQKIIKTAEKKK